MAPSEMQGAALHLATPPDQILAERRPAAVYRLACLRPYGLCLIRYCPRRVRTRTLGPGTATFSLGTPLHCCLQFLDSCKSRMPGIAGTPLPGHPSPPVSRSGIHHLEGPPRICNWSASIPHHHATREVHCRTDSWDCEPTGSHWYGDSRPFLAAMRTAWAGQSPAVTARLDSACWEIQTISWRS